MVDIILVIPPSPAHRKIARFSFQSFESKGSYLFQPREYLAITSCLKPGDGAVFIDGTCDNLEDEDYFCQLQEIDKGDILFFSLSNVCWDSDYDYFRKTVKLFPDIPVYVSGDIFLDIDFREKILSDCDGVVFLPYGLNLEKMAAFRKTDVEPLPGVSTKSEQNVFSGPKKITKILDGYPRHELFLNPGYRFPFARHNEFATMVTAYGCPNACSYCGSSNFPPAVRSHGAVLREMEHLADLGIKELFLYDLTFGFHKKESIPLLEEMKKRFGFSWTCFTNHQVCTPEFLELMHEAGCHTIMVGVDSSRVETLKDYKRSFRKDKLESLIEKANKLKMSVCADFIIGLEDETEDDIRSTINYALKLSIDFASFNVIVPTPGTLIRENLKRSGVSSADLTNFDSLGYAGNIGNKHLSGQRIIELRNDAVKKFYLRPSLILRRLRKTSSWKHFTIQFREMLSLFAKSFIRTKNI
jgi:anaerobic magnesium-protoporphyrin IX monomethyl ester cyclase